MVLPFMCCSLADTFSGVGIEWMLVQYSLETCDDATRKVFTLSIGLTVAI